MNVLFVIESLGYADHIAIAYLSAVAKAAGHQTFFCSLDSSNLKDVVLETEPDVVAYSVNVVGFKTVIEKHKEAKTVRQFVSIMGGPQATFSPETFNGSGMDAYCVGEGEQPFGEFLDAVANGRSFDNILNLITKKNRNDVRPLIDNLNALPMPDRVLVIANSFLKDISKKTFYTTRGCPYACNYCCNNYYHELYRKKGKSVRRFSVERIIQEIEFVKENFRTDFIKFGDDVFAMRVDDWLMEFVQKYKNRIGLPFNCFLRIDTVTDALLRLLVDAGCYSVHLSVDSTSSHVRDNILNRKMKRDVDLSAILRKIHSYGIHTWVNYMLAAPDSTTRNDIDTIFLSKKGKVTYASYSTTVPTNGTKLYQECLKRGAIDEGYVGDMNGCSTRSHLKCFSERDKDIRFNIFCLGAIASKLPYILMLMMIIIIILMPPNRLFIKLREMYYKYSIENTIYKVTHE